LQPFASSTAVVSTGLGETSVALGAYSFRFSYQELIAQFIGPQNVSASGLIALAPPANLAGDRTDFISGQAFTNQLPVSYDLTFAEIGSVTSVPTVATAQSVLQVTTTYTYAPPVPVPEPGGACLLVAGIVARSAS
jgi:hypothetical protein